MSKRKYKVFNSDYCSSYSFWMPPIFGHPKIFRNWARPKDCKS